MTAQNEPTRSELLAMAYVDGQLSPEDRTSLEAGLATDPELARHLAHYQALDLVTRSMAPPEPGDQEWARLEGGALHGSGSRLAWSLVTIGGLGLAAYGTYDLATSDSITGLHKTSLLALLGGGLLLVGLAIHQRMRLLPFDPYRKVKR